MLVIRPRALPRQHHLLRGPAASVSLLLRRVAERAGRAVAHRQRVL